MTPLHIIVAPDKLKLISLIVIFCNIWVSDVPGNGSRTSREPKSVSRNGGGLVEAKSIC